MTTIIVLLGVIALILTIFLIIRYFRNKAENNEIITVEDQVEEGQIPMFYSPATFPVVEDIDDDYYINSTSPEFNPPIINTPTYIEPDIIDDYIPPTSSYDYDDNSYSDNSDSGSSCCDSGSDCGGSD